MFENLTDKLERSFKLIKGEGRITEINVAETLKEIRRALIDADVNYKVAKSFTDEVKQKALGQDVLKAVKPGQMMTKIVRDELAELMGGTATDIRLEGTPAVILIAGLQGSGKTTFSGKLAAMLKSKKGRQVLLVAGDVYRPAAIDQLKVLGGQIGVEVYTEEGNKNPVQIAENAIKYARQHGFNVVIVDTAGRLAVDEAMMQEVAELNTFLKPVETLFVIDAMLGQDAVNTAKAFNERLPLTGVVLTKIDGDSRGGAALSVRHVTGKPIKFVGTAEKLTGFDAFDPEAMASRILGMGDIVGLVKDVQKSINIAEAEKLAQKISQGDKFDLNDFRAQLSQMNNMESFSSILEKLPAQFQEAASKVNDEEAKKSVRRTMGIIDSMTPFERRKPDLIKASRKKRIAAGAGVPVQEVNRLLKQFEQTQDMMKRMKRGGLGKMMRALGQFGRGGFPGMGSFGR